MSALRPEVDASGPAHPTTSGTSYAPTRNQLNIWLGQAATPDLPVFNELTVFVIDGPIDRDVFDRALQVTIEGTDALRTVVELEGALPRLRVRERFVYRSAFVDLAGAPDPDAALDQWSRRHVDTVLDLSTQLFDSTLVRLSPDRYAWALLHHHVVSDGTSMALVFERVGDWYARIGGGEEPTQVSYPTFADHVVRDEALRAGPRYRRLESFWQERLRDPAEPMVFYDGLSLTDGMGHQRVHQEVHLDAARAHALRGLAARDGIRFLSDDLSFFGVVAAALFVMLYRISGEPRRTIGAPWHNRTKALADTVGLVMEQDPFTISLLDDDTFATVIRKVQQEALAVVRHLPYAAGNPGGRIYDVVLNVIRVVVGPFAGLSVEPRWYRPSYGEGSLLVAVHDFVGSGDLVLGFDFNARLFTQEQRDAMIELFLHVLDECVDRPDGRITDFEVLSDRERRRIDTWNSTRRDFPRDATTIDLIEAQARLHPTAVAATSGDEELTYAALIERATALAAHLRDVGAGPGTFVGVCLNRSLDLLVAVLAVMRSGAAYVPLDPAFPPDRLAFMLEDCGASILLTERDLDAAVDPTGRVVVEIGDVDRAPDPHLTAPPGPGPDDLAYVLYTSGSTGRPKGVEIPHSALTNLLRSMAETPGCDEHDVLLAVTTLSFDIAALELFLPLLCGGQVEIASRGLAADGRQLRQRLDRGGITMLQATPATWRMLLEAGWAGTEGLTALIGGEPLPPDLVAPLLNRTAA
ncbi:MAG: AMP-binding protein, partial [Cellulomonas sp.]|nr:AMP-binding protein [Cellulomonas sp.]